jgi:MFS family permease
MADLGPGERPGRMGRANGSVMRDRTALLAALGADNFGSGLFLPLVLVYVIRDVGLPVGTAGTVIAVGTLAGLCMPPVAGRLVDRIGPRPVVIAAEVIQAAGALIYLAARGAGAGSGAAVLVVLVAAALLGAGQQLFYSSLFALLADVAGDQPRDRPFAVASMIRAACFGLGALAAAALLSLAGPVAYPVAVVLDAGSFVVCAALLAGLVRTPRARAAPPDAADTDRADTDRADTVPSSRSYRSSGSSEAEGELRSRLLADRPYLALIGITGLIALTSDFFLIGLPVFVLDRLHGPPWLPGTMLALSTAISAAGGTVALRVTRHWSRIAAMRVGAACYAAWCAAGLAALALPPGWRPTELLAATLLAAVGGLLFMRANALAEAAAPPPVRGRYLAGFQYAYTVAGVVAPALVALFSVATWLPWLLVGASAFLAVALLRPLAARLPAHAVRPAPARPLTSEAV